MHALSVVTDGELRAYQLHALYSVWKSRVKIELGIYTESPVCTLNVLRPELGKS